MSQEHQHTEKVSSFPLLLQKKKKKPKIEQTNKQTKKATTQLTSSGHSSYCLLFSFSIIFSNQPLSSRCCLAFCHLQAYCHEVASCLPYPWCQTGLLRLFCLHLSLLQAFSQNPSSSVHSHLFNSLRRRKSRRSSFKFQLYFPKPKKKKKKEEENVSLKGLELIVSPITEEYLLAW